MSFEICDLEIENQLSGWKEREALSRQAIDDYLQCTFPQSKRVSELIYRLDSNGYLKDIAYNGYMAPGWTAGPERERQDHWVYPLDPAEVKKIMALPPVPAKDEIATIINWPDLKKEGPALPSYDQARYALRLKEESGRLCLEVPHPDNFIQHPEVESMLREWVPPPFLKQTGAAVQVKSSHLRL